MRDSASRNPMDASQVQFALDDIDLPGGIEKRPLASQNIYGSLRRRIVDLDLKPGALLSRSELAKSYEVSQTPVRDAFFQLEREGLIAIFPQSRSLVAKIDIAQARETQFLRMALEIEVTKTLAARADPNQTRLARKITERQSDAFEAGLMERFAALDRYFHLSLCEAAGYPDLWRVIAERSGHIDRLRALNLPDPGKATGILKAHGDILDAIEAGDAAACEAAVRSHLSGTLSAVAAIRERYPDYFK